MVAVPPLILVGDLKISDQKNFFGGGAKFKGGPTILGGGPMNIVGKGVTPPPFLDQPPFSKIPPLSRNPRCPHLS